MTLLSFTIPDIKISPTDNELEVVGPTIPVNVKIWQTLADFRHWHLWMDGVERTLRVYDEEELDTSLGRGSKVQLIGSANSHTLEILYWQPPHRFVYATGEKGQRTAVCYEINTNSQTSEAAISVNAEVEVSGLRKMLSPWIALTAKKRLIKQNQSLLEQLS